MPLVEISSARAVKQKDPVNPSSAYQSPKNSGITLAYKFLFGFNL